MKKQINLPHSHNDFSEHVLSNMPSLEASNDAAMIFDQLSDVSRLRILWLLCHTEECGINIAAAVNMIPAAVSHHLKKLKLSGLVVSRRDGKEVYYKLSDNPKAKLVHKMIDSMFEITFPEKCR